jgi:drug/metabolite transporter (DMT)-like permease
MNQDTKALLFGLVAVGCWSTVATAFKLALSYIDTFQLLFYSTLTACLVLTATVLVRNGARTLVSSFKNHWQMALIAGLLNPVIYYLVLFRAYDVLPAQVALSINYTWAIVLSMMAIVFLKQKILAADMIAAVVCYSGVFVIATQGDITSFANADLWGLALALLSTFIWASYWTLNIRDKREPVTGLCMNFLVALPVTATLCFTFSGFTIPIQGLAGSVYVGLMEMAIAFIFWSIALNLTANAARVSNLIFLSPFVSLIIVNKVLGEEIYSTTLAGLVLIIAGLLYQQYAHKQGASPGS